MPSINKFFISIIFSLLILFIITNITYVTAHHESVGGEAVSGKTVSEPPESISETPAEKISGSLGEIDSATGQPKEFSFLISL